MAVRSQAEPGNEIASEAEPGNGDATSARPLREAGIILIGRIVGKFEEFCSFTPI